MTKLLHQTIAARCQEFREDFGPELVSAIINAFIPDTQRRLVVLQQALAARRVEAVLRAAHGLKGSCYNVGAQCLGDICGELERLAPSGDWVRCDLLYNELAAKFITAQTYLEAEKKW